MKTHFLVVRKGPIMVGPDQSQSEGSQRVSGRVLEAVAEAEGTEPVELDRPLYEVFDPDALDTLFESGASNPRADFTYLGYQVTVTADGDIRLDRPDG